MKQIDTMASVYGWKIFAKLSETIKYKYYINNQIIINNKLFIFILKFK